jgi:hypothetical protein
MSKLGQWPLISLDVGRLKILVVMSLAKDLGVRGRIAWSAIQFVERLCVVVGSPQLQRGVDMPHECNWSATILVCPASLVRLPRTRSEGTSLCWPAQNNPFDLVLAIRELGVAFHHVALAVLGGRPPRLDMSGRRIRSSILLTCQTCNSHWADVIRVQICTVFLPS